ncbi:hypothetical protein M885DRAFT_584853 [Pelagophyceae sp. CCMP2097]|nr:hypothetical protein M885DRAFT_584853 [Pelagophyceae sp. CCMP2097]
MKRSAAERQDAARQEGAEQLRRRRRALRGRDNNAPLPTVRDAPAAPLDAYREAQATKWADRGWEGGGSRLGSAQDTSPRSHPPPPPSRSADVARQSGTASRGHDASARRPQADGRTARTRPNAALGAGPRRDPSAASMPSRQFRTAASMPSWLHAATPLESRQFRTDGFVVVRRAVAAGAVAAAARAVRDAVARGAYARSGGGLTNLDDDELRRHAAIAALGDGARGAAEVLVGCGLRAAGPPQIAVRFPAERTGPPRANSGTWWHIDNLKNGATPGFDVLVGVPLTETTADDAGNLAVHPSAHHDMAPQVRRAALAGPEALRRLHEERRDLGPPRQLHLRIGVVAFLDAMLPHFGAPNHSTATRIHVYFRFARNAAGAAARR